MFNTTTVSTLSKRNSRPPTSVLEEDTDATLLALGSREMQQCPTVGVPDLGRVALLQHLAHGVDIAGCHRCLDLQLLLQVRVPSEVMVQHPVTLRSHSCVPEHRHTTYE